jgi:hypothetical protein
MIKRNVCGVLLVSFLVRQEKYIKVCFLIRFIHFFFLKEKVTKRNKKLGSFIAGSNSSGIPFASSLAAYLPADGRKGCSRQSSDRRGRVR